MINMRHLIPILLILVGVQVAATYLAVPVQLQNVEVFGDPESTESPFIYLGIVILVTFLILGLYKLGLIRFIKAFFLLTVWATMYFVASTLVLMYGEVNTVTTLLVWTVSIGSVILIWKYPEWYVIDIIGFIECVGVSAILGVSFGIIPVIMVLVIFAVYDAVSVYKTRHMIKLAETTLNEKLPALFIIPKDKDFSYLDSKTWDNLDDTTGRQSYIIGMGDIIFPSVMVVSASVFIVGEKVWGVFTIPAIGAMIGSWVGMVALQWYASKNQKSHAGLPFLNSFTILGFAVAYGVSLLMV